MFIESLEELSQANLLYLVKMMLIIWLIIKPKLQATIIEEQILVSP